MKKVIDTLFKVCDYKNPRLELQHVLVENDRLVFTDTFILVSYHAKTEVDGQALLINDKAKYKYDIQKRSIIFDTMAINDGFSYPNVDRIIDPANNNEVNISDKDYTLINALYLASINYNVSMDFIKLATKLKALDKILGKAVKLYNNDKLIKIVFEQDHEFLIMGLNL